MTLFQVLLIVGLFILPVVLLRTGHQLRFSSSRARRVFWGGTIGYGVGMTVMLIAMHYPPVLWAGARTLVVYCAIVIGTLGGMLLGALRGDDADPVG